MSKEKRHKRVKPKRANTTKYYNILIVGTIVLAFLLIGLVYIKVLQDSFVAKEIAFMQGSADRIIQEIYEEEATNHLDAFPEELRHHMKLLADVSDTYIWVVRPNGQLFYASAIPQAALENVRFVQDRSYFLENNPSVIHALDKGVTLNGGDFFGVFSRDSGDWITVSRPLENVQGQYFGSLLIHYPLSQFSLRSSHVFMGLAALFLLAVLVATLIVKGYVNQMAKPIDLLSEAAAKVTEGDLYTRIDVEAYEEEQNSLSQQNDDWVNLMLTFNQMVDQIQMQNREQRDFIASVSHDLRTPLTSISGFIDAIVDGVVAKEDVGKYLGIIQDETKRLSTLVSDMNTMITLEQSPENLEMKVFDLHDVILRVVEAMEFLIREKHISVQSNFQNVAEHELLVMANEAQIERVLYNLISNAVKFVNEGGIIAIRTEKRGKNIVKIDVEDNGPGIAPEDIPYVFDRFFKSDRSRTGRKGSGLGLYICKKILQSHGQSIFASKSKLGGAKFEFTLPLA